MTHEAEVDDGDLEIEEWEKADAAMAAQGLSEIERRAVWDTLLSPEQVEQNQVLAQVMEELGCNEERAWRVIHALYGAEF